MVSLRQINKHLFNMIVYTSFVSPSIGPNNVKRDRGLKYSDRFRAVIIQSCAAEEAEALRP